MVLVHTCAKDADRLANIVDPDILYLQQSDQGLHCLPRPVCPNI